MESRKPVTYRSHADWCVHTRALQSFVEGFAEHAAELHRMTIHSINLGPPVQGRLKRNGKRGKTPKENHKAGVGKKIGVLVGTHG